MPYEIRKYKYGWRVYAEDGRPLSKNPLTLKKAEAQRTAVNIAEFADKPKMTGGAKQYVEIPVGSTMSGERYAKINQNVADFFKPFEMMKYMKENPKTILLPSEKKARKQKLMELRLAGIDPSTVADEAKGEVAQIMKSYEELPSLRGDYRKVPDELKIIPLEGEGKPQPRSKFAKQLEEIGLKPDDYLDTVRKIAKLRGYATMPTWSDNDKHKLMIKTPEGHIRRFGAVGYGDYLIWSWLEHKKKVPVGTAEKKAYVFNRSHSKIKGDWKDDKYSPNYLALKLLW
jgi:hypothetical protein